MSLQYNSQKTVCVLKVKYVPGSNYFDVQMLQD